MCHFQHARPAYVSIFVRLPKFRLFFWLGYASNRRQVMCPSPGDDSHITWPHWPRYAPIHVRPRYAPIGARDSVVAIFVFVFKRLMLLRCAILPEAIIRPELVWRTAG